MPENYEDFSLTPRTRNSRKTLRILARNWTHQSLPLCLARQARTVIMGRPVVNPMRSNQNLHVFWKLVNPRECVWENLYRVTMRTILQEEETIHCNIPIWYTNLFLCLKAMKIPAAKAAVYKEWEKLEKILARDLTKVRSKIEVIDEARKKKVEKFTSLHWWTSVNWRMPNRRQSTKNTKVELFSEVTLWKMILDLMQYSLNKDHQHHKWRQQKSWISNPDCQGAQDKQRTQYLLVPR